MKAHLLLSVSLSCLLLVVIAEKKKENPFLRLSFKTIKIDNMITVFKIDSGCSICLYTLRYTLDALVSAHMRFPPLSLHISTTQ